MDVCAALVDLVPVEARGGVGSSGTAVSDGHELPVGAGNQH